MKALSVIAMLMMATPAFAAEKAGVKMADTATIGDKAVVLNGLGVREATVFNVDVYVAGLYLETRSSDGEAIAASEQAKRLDLRFVRDVDRGDITEAWVEGFKKNGADINKLKDRIGRLNSWMSGIDEGQSLSFTYQPGKGLAVSVKGQEKGVIEGADFATAFFRIWLGPKPPNSGLKRGLLGK